MTSGTRHQHHFEDLSPDDFERLVYWLVKRSGDFDEVQWCGGARDKGRDVVAYKHTPTGREKWYIQCKRYRNIAFSTLRDELDKLAEHVRANPNFAPNVIVFATACAVSPDTRDKATEYARSLGLPEPYYWGRLELDERLKAQPEVEEEFFGLGALLSKPGTRKGPIYALIGLLLGAGGDLLINLLAAAIQQRSFADQFSVSAIWWLAGLSVAGLLLGYWLGVEVPLPAFAASRLRNELSGKARPVTITRLRALLSRAKLRGKGIFLRDILLIGSRLEIETDAKTED